MSESLENEFVTYVEDLLRQVSIEDRVMALVGYLVTKDPDELVKPVSSGVPRSIHREHLRKFFHGRDSSAEDASQALRPLSAEDVSQALRSLLERRIHEWVEQSRTQGETAVAAKRPGENGQIRENQMESKDSETMQYFDDLQPEEQRALLAELYSNAYERLLTVSHLLLIPPGTLLLGIIGCASLVVTILFLHVEHALSTIIVSIILFLGFLVCGMRAVAMERESNWERVRIIKALAEQYEYREIVEDIAQEERNAKETR